MVTRAHTQTAGVSGRLFGSVLGVIAWRTASVRVARSTLAWVSLACAVAPAACFIGYDSRWGEAKAAQKRLAAQSAPGPIAATETDPRRAERTYRVRFRPDAQYLAQTVDPERQIDELVGDANRVLESGLGLHLDVDTTQPWAIDADDDLQRSMTALCEDDPGNDVDVVVGLIGALPRPTEALHQAGLAEILGKHMIVRAASRLGEHDAIDRAMNALSDDERDRVVRARRRHRAEAVFLHELGHILGALHETEVASLMHPSYDEKMNHFGINAVGLMRLALDDGDRRTIARAQLAYVREEKSASWSPGDRETAIKALEQMAPPTAAAQPPILPQRTAVEAPTSLREGDRDRFVRAMQVFRAGDPAAAYETARPLFTSYPDNYGVQDLRCQLATVRWLSRDEMVAECASSTRLADAGATK